MRLLLALLLGASLSAQSAASRSFGVACNTTGKALVQAGISLSAPPQLGTSPRLRYSGPNFFYQAPFTSDYAHATAYMFLGVRDPQLSYNGCQIHSSAELIFYGVRGTTFEVPLQIPNDARLIGMRLYAQAAFSYFSSSCMWTCVNTSDQGLSPGLELTLGR